MLLQLASLVLFAKSVSSVTSFEVSGNRIKDEYGREVFFHGVNVVYKSPPYLPIVDHFDPQLSFSIEDMQLLNELGQNIIRLGVMWPGVNPAKDYYNETYIATAKQLIQTAYEQYGIYTLVDCHQDVLAECFCGEGAPNWAMNPRLWDFPLPVAKKYDFEDASTHTPSRSDCLSHGWPSYYPSGAVGSAFQAIYRNKDGLGEAFADYWGVLAQRLKETDGVVGFELMNEPWAGDIETDPFLMLPGQADRKNLEPFYDLVVPRIYGNDSSRLVFFESVTWTDEYNISVTESGFESVPGGDDYASNSVYSFHYYVPPNKGDQSKYFSETNNEAKRWGCTAMLTEFDISNDGESENTFESQSKVMDSADKYFNSWIGWEYKKYAGALSDGTCTGCGYGVFKANGEQNNMVSKTLSRTYAQSVCGRTEEISFDYKTGDFKLRFALDSGISQPTVLYANGQYWYPNGFEVIALPANAVTDIKKSNNGNANRIEVYTTDDNSLDGTVVTVTLKAS